MYGFVDYGRLTITVMSWLLVLTVLEFAVSRRNHQLQQLSDEMHHTILHRVHLDTCRNHTESFSDDRH
jgi:hypothetical protein